MWADYRIEYVNPPDPTYLIPIPSQVWFGQTHVGEPDIWIGLNLTYTGTLTASTLMTLHGYGVLVTNASQESVENVSIGFAHALKFPIEYYNEIAVDGFLTLKKQGNNLVNASSSQIIEAVPGDYPVEWLIWYVDNSSSVVTFPDSSIHVEPASELQTEKFARVNQGLTLALTSP